MNIYYVVDANGEPITFFCCTYVDALLIFCQMILEYRTIFESECPYRLFEVDTFVEIIL